MMGPFLWDGVPAATGNRLQVMDSSLGDGQGWEYDTDYDVLVDYRSDGTIDVRVSRVDDGSLLWHTTVTDPAPLGAGRVGFFNMGQPGVQYQAIGETAGLGEGLHRLTTRSGARAWSIWRAWP